MKKIDEYFEIYGQSHQNATNKLIHWIAVPAIVFSLLGLIWSIPVPEFMQFTPFFNWASLLLAIVLYYYYTLSPILAFTMVFVVGLFSFFYVLIEKSAYPLWQISLVIFVVAWIFQFIGHKIEGKKPSFLDDIKFLLIGPLWLLHFLFKKIGLAY